MLAAVRRRRRSERETRLGTEVDIGAVHESTRLQTSLNMHRVGIEPTTQ